MKVSGWQVANSIRRREERDLEGLLSLNASDVRLGCRERPDRSTAETPLINVNDLAVSRSACVDRAW